MSKPRHLLAIVIVLAVIVNFAASSTYFLAKYPTAPRETIFTEFWRVFTWSSFKGWF